MGAEVKENKDLVEQALTNNEGGEGNLKETGIIGENTKGQIEKIGLEKPITEENLEVGENIPKEVVEHILKNNFKVQNSKFIKCVDGRNPEDNIKGIYMPGGTDGLLILVFNLLTQYNIDINPKKIRDVLVEVIGGEENYYYHSDEHNINKPGACGCGHDNLVLNNENHICNLAPKYSNFIIEQRRINRNSMEILEGKHEEQGVLLLDIEGVSIIPRGNNTSFFVYNQKEVQKILKEFILKLNKENNLNISVNNALKELDQEVLSTFNILGGEASHYRINFKDGKYKIEFNGKVSDVVTNYYLGE